MVWIPWVWFILFSVKLPPMRGWGILIDKCLPVPMSTGSFFSNCIGDPMDRMLNAVKMNSWFQIMHWQIASLHSGKMLRTPVQVLWGPCDRVTLCDLFWRPLILPGGNQGYPHYYGSSCSPNILLTRGLDPLRGLWFLPNRNRSGTHIPSTHYPSGGDYQYCHQ